MSSIFGHPRTPVKTNPSFGNAFRKARRYPRKGDGAHIGMVPGATDCTERHTAERAYSLDGEGHEGTPKAAQAATGTAAASRLATAARTAGIGSRP